MKRALTAVLVAGTAAALTAAGAVPTADHMTSQVLRIVEPVAWADFWRPYWNPPPMSVAGVRPVSVLLMKAAALVSPADQPAPVALNAALSFGTLVAFAAGALAWLRRWGAPAPAAVAAAVGALMLSPTLFSAWYLPELDALGAGLTLGGLALLARPGPLGWRWAPTVALLALALFLKESSALVCFALLAAAAGHLALQGRRALALRHLGALGAGGLLWAAVAAPLLSDSTSALAGASPLDRLPVIEHDAVQLLYLASAAGAALLALGALPARAWRSWAGPGAAAAAAVALALAPLLERYNHYEAVYYTARPAATALAVALMGGLVVHAVRGRGRGGLAPLALGPLAIYAAVTATSLLAATAREDMAARILLAAAPMLLALAAALAGRIWGALSAAPRGPRRTGRGALGLLVAALAWYPLGSAVNAALDWRASHGVDQPARVHLAGQPLPGSVLIFNHYVQWLGGAELTALGAAPELDAQASIVLSPAWLRADRLPAVDWGRGEVDIEGRWRSGTPTRLYWLAKRSEMDPSANAALLGDLSWTRRPMGLFTPMAPADDALGTLPAHNLPEDLRQTTYRAGAAPLETLARLRGVQTWSATLRYGQLPVDLLSVPRRLLSGVPLLERYRMEARVLHLDPPASGAPAPGPPPPR